jgi:hypothetical protein
MSQVERKKKLDLSRIVFIGRTFEEYMSMFNLHEVDLEDKRILDCPAGPCSFTAVATQHGFDVTACDAAYDHPLEELEKKGFEDIEHAMQHMEHAKDNYAWNYFTSVKDLRNARVRALSDFILDKKRIGAQKRYIPSLLPNLPFPDHHFDLTLSAHFLFTYADRLDDQFHRKTIQEFMRVTKSEIRLFPLVDLSGKRYTHLDQLIEWVENQGWSAEECTVPYEFQAKANCMLQLKRLV